MIFELLYLLTEKIVLLIGKLGYFGIFIGMTIESSFFPFPSEIILIPAGVLISKGEFSFFLVLLASILGSLLGALINYSIALIIGRNAVEALVSKYGKFFFISKKGLLHSEKTFKKYGNISTLIGRLIPAVRQLISLPAGFFKMRLDYFLLFTALGAGIWTCFLLGVGYFFNEVSMQIWKENSLLFYASSFLLCMIVLVGYLILKQKNKP